jgi:hypothetical protein
MKRSHNVKQRGKRGRRKANRKAERHAVPVMVAVRIRGASKFIVFAFLVWSGLASATTYYVSSSTGNDANNGNKPGAEKKDAAMSFLQNALAMTDAVAAREIINPDGFKDGISKIIDGTVECLNASTWCKKPPATNTQPSA